MLLTEELAKFVCETRDVPAAVTDAATAALLDTLGCALAGTREPVAQMAADYVADLGAAPRAAVWGRAFASSAADAAFVNGGINGPTTMSSLWR